MNKQFKHLEEGAKGEFQLSINGEILAHMTYSRIDANNIIVDHTAVDPKAKGMGLGKAIVDELVHWAREHAQKILPLCPFAKGVIEQNNAYHDILRK